MDSSPLSAEVCSWLTAHDAPLPVPVPAVQLPLGVRLDEPPLDPGLSPVAAPSSLDVPPLPSSEASASPPSSRRSAHLAAQAAARPTAL